MSGSLIEAWLPVRSWSRRTVWLMTNKQLSRSLRSVRGRQKWIGLTAAAVLATGALAGCSSDSTDDATTSPTTTTSPTDTSTASPSPSRIVAVLCDKATDQQIEALEASVSADYTVSQVTDVRTDDESIHALLAFVEGPGLAVLAQWIGTGDPLTDLQSANEFAAEVSDAPLASNFDQDTQDLLDNTTKCYTQLYGPDADE